MDKKEREKKNLFDFREILTLIGGGIGMGLGGFRDGGKWSAIASRKGRVGLKGGGGGGGIQI